MGMLLLESGKRIDLSPHRYDGNAIVQKSVDIQSPVIYVSFNHRTNGKLISVFYPVAFRVLKFALGFGFLASQELTDAGVANLGLQDRKCIGTVQVPSDA